MRRVLIQSALAVLLLFRFVAAQEQETAARHGSTPPPAMSGDVLAIIVNKENPVENLSFEELRKLCLLRRTHWDNGRKVTVVLLQAPQPERAVVLKTIYGMEESEFDRYFLQGSFTGELQARPKTLATAAGVKRFVFNVPGAIAFARVSELDDTVKVVRLDGRAPGDPLYELKLPTKP
jgi:ABC-type phosphate transport system substrate-binding protein